MAKRNTNSGATVGNGNGNSRPALAFKTNDKGQVFSHIRQKWLIETPEERVRQAKRAELLRISEKHHG
jgi:hypothetical protein